MTAMMQRAADIRCDDGQQSSPRQKRGEMSATTITAAPGTTSELETSTIRAISWRLIPFLVLAYFLAYLDRVNLGFAALTMNAELKFSPTVFAWGAGIFFIGYFIFEVPSNLALEKFGASRWIARIMVTWGIISALMALVSGVWSFYAFRFLLGVAEAGFFPGIIFISPIGTRPNIARAFSPPSPSRFPSPP
jgi:sugar phosphate permease